jgi:thiamine-monophosphate kinase
VGLPDERELIDQITAGLTSRRNRAGFASDCALVPFDDAELVVSVDAFADDTHFPEGLPPKEAGRLAAGAALSDLAAAGAEPIGAQVAYGVPPEIDRSTVFRLAEAVAARVEDAGGEILGGDTKPRRQLTLAVTVLGSAPSGEAMTRQAARPGEHVVVTGPLGGAGAALDRIRDGMDAARAHPLIPPDRIEAGRRLRRAGARCAMDLSDGLAEAAHAISQASKVRLAIDADRIPLHAWAQEDEGGLEHALTTGGDYELLATVGEDALDTVREQLADLNLETTVVGRVEEGEAAVLQPDGGTRELGRGFEHRFDP